MVDNANMASHSLDFVFCPENLPASHPTPTHTPRIIAAHIYWPSDWKPYFICSFLVCQPGSWLAASVIFSAVVHSHFTSSSRFHHRNIYVLFSFCPPPLFNRVETSFRHTNKKKKEQEKKSEENELQILWRDKPFGNRMDFSFHSAEVLCDVCVCYSQGISDATPRAVWMARPGRRDGNIMNSCCVLLPVFYEHLLVAIHSNSGANIRFRFIGAVCYSAVNDCGRPAQLYIMQINSVWFFFF